MRRKERRPRNSTEREVEKEASKEMFLRRKAKRDRTRWRVPLRSGRSHAREGDRGWRKVHHQTSLLSCPLRLRAQLPSLIAKHSIIASRPKKYK
tara:strand:+ start:790 stop:1071 length:282 start_codon:yes stop_codon:yes gene_type:complete